MNSKAIFLFSFFIVLCSYMNGQVLPPIVDCVNNDTIYFTPVPNSCGPFISYDVFTSPNPNGPFNLLGNISDPSLDFFLHPNSASAINYYYISPTFNCPGEAIINSDTVSNRPPEVSIIHTVSVINNFNNLAWEPSPSPEVIDYSVFLVTDMGLELLIVTPNLTYIDMLRDPSIQSHSYLIVANDACGNRSIFSDPTASVHLSLSVTGANCDESIDFVWNTHINTVAQEVWAKDVNGNDIFIEAIGPNEENYFIDEITLTGVTKYFIRAYLNSDQSLIADSNVEELTFIPNVEMDEIHFTRLSTFNDNSYTIEWCWNDDADLNRAQLSYTSPSLNDFNTVSISDPLLSTVSENINFIVGIPELYSFQVETIDACDVIFNSEEINSIFLEATPISENELRIKWSAFDYPDSSLDSYQVFASINGNEELIYEGLATEQIVSREIEGGEVCYYVKAFGQGTLNDGSQKETEIISNLACSRGLPIIRMPNAFNPYGINSIFKPLVGNVDAIASYEMKVFSRYGELLYQSDTIEQGWNGRSGLREMPQGVYTYLVDVNTVGGEQVQIKGTVLLIR